MLRVSLESKCISITVSISILISILHTYTVYIRTYTQGHIVHYTSLFVVVRYGEEKEERERERETQRERDRVRVRERERET